MTFTATRRSAVWAGALVVTALPLATANQARADEVREKELEDRVQQLEQQLERLSDEVRGGYALGYNSELDARVAELEKATGKDGNGLFWQWKGGNKASTLDKRFKFQVGGRIMVDFTGWASNRDTEYVVGDQLTTGTEFRRARMFMSGTLYKNVHFKAQYDFGGGDATFKSVYLAFTPGYGRWTVGHHYEPFGLEEQTSSKYIWFPERSAPNAAFSPGRNTGISFGNAGNFGDGPQDYTYQIGVFRDADDYGDDTANEGEGEWNFTGRFTARPFVDEENDAFVHVGVSGSWRHFSDEMTRFRARPQVHIAPRFVDTGWFEADHGAVGGLELAGRFGSAFVEAEYMTACVHANDLGDPRFDGLTATVGFILTGEIRPYKEGSWSRIKPKGNVGEKGGKGAITLGLRYSEIDLSNGEIDGGDMDIWSAALNWHLNPHTRIMLGVEHIDLQREMSGMKADDVQAVTMRYQIDF